MLHNCPTLKWWTDLEKKPDIVTKVTKIGVWCLPKVDLGGTRSKQFQAEYEKHYCAPPGYSR